MAPIIRCPSVSQATCYPLTTLTIFFATTFVSSTLFTRHFLPPGHRSANSALCVLHHERYGDLLPPPPHAAAAAANVYDDVTLSLAPPAATASIRMRSPVVRLGSPTTVHISSKSFTPATRSAVHVCGTAVPLVVAQTRIKASRHRINFIPPKLF